MLHPWQFPQGWEEKATNYYNVTRGTSEFNHYFDTLTAFYDNSFKVPCFAGFAILALFTFVVLVAAISNIISIFFLKTPSALYRNSIVILFKNHIKEAPLFRKSHAKVYRLGTLFFSIQAPLCGQTVLLLGLLIANLVPLISFYTPYTAYNVFWPNDRWHEVGRYLSDRAGILAIAQLPPLILLSGRNNPVSLLTGVSFSTCMLYHRWFARLVFMQVLVHAIGYTVISITKGSGTYKALFADLYLRMGLVATIFMAFMCFFAMRYFRAKAYEWFVLTHILFAIIVVIGIFYHIKLLDEGGSYADFVNLIYASIFFWCFEKAIRFARIFVLNASFSSISGICISHGVVSLAPGNDDLLSIKIKLRGNAADHWLKEFVKTCTGRSVQLWIPRVQPLSSHPFTVAGVEIDERGGMCLQLFVKVYDGITQRLMEKVQQNRGEVNLSMMVEGFYGRRTEVSQSKTLIMIAGGIGATQTLPYLIDALRQGSEAHMIWLIRDPAIVVCAIQLLQGIRADKKIEGEVNEMPLKKQSLSIYITRSIAPQSPTEMDEKKPFGDEVITEVVPTLQISSQDEMSEKSTGPDPLSMIQAVCPLLDVQIHQLQCRPSLEELLTEELSSMSEKDRRSVEAICCGPAELLDDTRQLSRRYDLQYYEEGFSW